MQNKSERIEAVELACDAWSKVIDGIIGDIMESVDKYSAVRLKCHEVFLETTKIWMKEGAIEQEKEAAGEPNRMEEWRQEYHETLAIRLAVYEKIDKLNAIKFLG